MHVRGTFIYTKHVPLGVYRIILSALTDIRNHKLQHPEVYLRDLL
jgi:hypothetical protein